MTRIFATLLLVFQLLLTLEERFDSNSFSYATFCYLQTTIFTQGRGGNNDIWTKWQENVYFGDVTINRPVAKVWGVLREPLAITSPQNQLHLFSYVVKAVKCTHLVIPNANNLPHSLPWILHLKSIIEVDCIISLRASKRQNVAK